MSTAALRRRSDAPTIVMGVTGCGKSTVGQALADAVGHVFVDGDGLHGPANIAKMAAGTPLTDADRWPWFDRIISTFREGKAGVIGCSALKRAYRDYLRAGVPGLQFVYLKADRELITARVAARSEHFMPVSLVESQFRTLESPEGEAGVLTIAADAPLGDIVAAWLGSEDQ